jgi:hypothetical protein
VKRISRSKQRPNAWALAQNEWLPLAKAIFHFAGIDAGASDTSEKKRHQLNARLGTISKEPDSDIVWNDQRFYFPFSSGQPIRSHPWQILRFIKRKVPSPSGPLLMSEYEAFLQRVLSATLAVWRDDMLAGFNRAASAGSILMFGRLDKMASPFVRLPPDIWLQVEVHDWNNGNAKAADGTDIWSIHAVTAIPSLSSRVGRKPFYDQDQVNRKVLRILKEKGRPTASGDINWQANADLEKMVAAFCKRVMDREPSKSTTQQLVKKALDYCTSRGL